MTLQPHEDVPAQGTTYGNGDHRIIGAHFDKMAEKYKIGSKKVEWIGPIVVFEALQAEINKRSLNNNDLFILDLGTGHGELGEHFKQKHNGTVHVTGVDLSQEMLKRATEGKHIDRAIHSGAEDLPWSPSNEFHIVTCVGVLDFIENTQNFAKEVTRVLKPGGLFGFCYEPQGTEFPGVKSIKHHTPTLRGQFERNGAEIITIEEQPSIFKNFITGVPVTNNIMVGRMPD